MSANLRLGDTRMIIEECKKHGLLRNQAAYVLATAFHETSHTMKPVRESLAKTDAEAKRRLTKAWKAGKMPGVKSDYWSGGYYGRGYPQTTHLANYRWASEVTGVDLVKYPDRMMEPQVAVTVMLVGMIEGRFRKGHKLSRYITREKSDFYGAREIINGDKRRNGKAIADLAYDYDRALKADGYGVDLPVPAPKPTPKPEAAPAPAADPKQAILKLGATGKYVSDLQTSLETLGYYDSPVTGTFDKSTEEAVKAFQIHNKLLADGIAGIRTNTAIGEALKAKEQKPAIDAAKQAVNPVAKETLSPAEILTGVTAVGTGATAVKETVNAVNEGAASLVSAGPWVVAGLLGVGFAWYVWRDLRAKKAAAVKASEALS